ncbi:unnamed protein product [Ectocarpus sp. CCAP 1310/34]|nr:unnamed protein product [Ectocarpus sp. CCAP 1310/34]
MVYVHLPTYLPVAVVGDVILLLTYLLSVSRRCPRPRPSTSLLYLLNPFTLVRLCLAVYLCLALSVRLAALWDHTQQVQDVDHNEGSDSMPGGAMPSQLRRLLDVLDSSVGSHARRLGGNPWTEPPESIVVKGLKNIRGYFEDLYAEPCRIKRSSVKVVLVGQEGAGKTRSAMRWPCCYPSSTAALSPNIGWSESFDTTQLTQCGIISSSINHTTLSCRFSPENRLFSGER